MSGGEKTRPGRRLSKELAATVPAGDGAVTKPAALLHYRLLEKIGEGGMGAVFKAEDRRLGRIVAIKHVARGGDEQETARVRLLREARAASALNHPNIVVVHAIEEVGDDAFLVMEYLEGETLAALIARGRLEPARVIAIGVEIADALACAHAAGLVHRDVKPANVIITRRGITKVLDFGVATQVAERSLSSTVESAIVGTAPYMSPEQLRGQAVDDRSDVFALGCVLYEVVTGRRAFPADDFATLVQQITTGDPTPPRELTPGVPPGLEAIILRALAKDPSHRVTAAEMAAALRARTDGDGAAPLPTSVAVLPFLDLSAERDQDFLCDGIAEEILTALTHVEGLRVAARSTSFQFKAKGDVDARTAGTRLGVDAVLEGSVRKAGDRLRVTVQLVDVAGGHQRWSHRFDGVTADVFAIQDEIATTTARLLRGVLSATTQNALRRPGTTPEAYEHFLRGRQFLRAHGTTSLALAQRSLERAISVDPSYAPAYATLAQVHAFLVDWHAGGKPAAAVTGAIKIVLIVITTLLVLASLGLIANTIRLSIYARRREVEVMRLVGATNWFIRWPFMVEGLVVGFVGGLIAVGVLLAGKLTVVDPLSERFALVAAQNTINFLPLVIVLLAAATAVSAVGSGLTLRRFLRV